MSDALLFDPVTHTYTVGSKKLPGVTTIMKSANLTQDFSMVDPALLARAADLGTRVHRGIELAFKHGLSNAHSQVDFDVVDYLDAWDDFLKTSGFEPMMSEHQLCSTKYGYAGTLDLFGTLNGELVLPDIKRVNAVSRSAGPQTAAYLHLLQENYPELAWGTKGNKRFVLHLKPGSKWSLVPLTGKDDFKVFLSALSIHNWKASK